MGKDIELRREAHMLALRDDKDATAAVSETLTKGEELEKSISTAFEDKASIEQVLSEHFAPLKQGCDPADAKKHCDILTPCAARVSTDESLMVALPGSCQ